MRALMQRVSRAKVTVDDGIVGTSGMGWVILLGVTHGDTEETADRLADRAANLRCFSDKGGKMNLSALEVQAEMLVVSQFTLYADTTRGRRPSFVNAAGPELADPLVQRFAQRLRDHGLRVETGRFGAHMMVELVNDGPVTIVLDSDDRR